MKVSLADLKFARLALFVSVALNIALGAYLASQWMMPRWRPLADIAPSQVVDLVARRMPSAEAGIVREAYRQRQGQIAGQREAFVRARTKTLDLLAQPDLDVPALRAAMQDAREQRLKQVEVLIDMFVEIAGKLPPQVRQDLAARFRR